MTAFILPPVPPTMLRPPPRGPSPAETATLVVALVFVGVWFGALAGLTLVVPWLPAGSPLP